jgi:ELWxxDGT repeat protein
MLSLCLLSLLAPSDAVGQPFKEPTSSFTLPDGVKLTQVANLTEMNGYLFFTAHHPDYGVELWRTDGTSEGTKLVKDINVRSRESGKGPTFSSNPRYLTVLPGNPNLLVFAADDGIHGEELWVSNGELGAEGTVLLKDINPTGQSVEKGAGGFGSSPHELTVVNGAIYFLATDGENGMRLWRTDGTRTGTKPAESISGVHAARIGKAAAEGAGRQP